MHTITITFAWWWIPTAITVIMFAWALRVYLPDRNNHWTSLLGLIIFIPALLVSLLVWIAAAILK